MTPSELLADLRARGIDLWVRGGKTGLSGQPTEADRAAIAQHREALLDLLWHEQPDPMTVLGPWTYTPGEPRS